MKKIVIQAGHANKISGTTGAPNGQAFNVDISNIKGKKAFIIVQDNQ